MKFRFFILTFFLALNCIAQNTAPKLVVGIVVDQMRYDYINKYWDKYGEGGFKKLVSQGAFCKNVNFNYVPTYTAPGHASIYSGTTPSFNGIIANDWYNREINRNFYCVEDTSVNTVGSDSKGGKMSPKNLLATTVTDELKLQNKDESKVFGISLKDRGAVLPAGHLPNGAFWYDAKTGNFITSTFYTNALPTWVSDFNTKKLPAAYMSKDWTTLYSIEKYKESAADNNEFEGMFKGETKPVFPHKLAHFIKQEEGLGIIRSTPFGNSLIKDLAIQLVKSENLGKSYRSDFLAISFSSTDYVGHMYGPQSIEVQDTYLRLDKDLEELLNFLETQVGKDNLLVFLTADHAAAQAPSFAQKSNIPGGYVDDKFLKDTLNKFLKSKFGFDLVTDFTNQQVYLNHNIILKNNIRLRDAQQVAADFFNRFNYIENSLPAYSLNDCYYTSGIPLLIQNGYHTKRSGDVMVNYLPGWMEYHKTGTTHGSPYNYDTHVPLIWYGWKIKQAELLDAISIIDIAPTLSFFLGIPFPNATTGKPIQGLVK
ncbi:MAG: alkaline phosphatase PafA [Bacteroidota bacterium]